MTDLILEWLQKNGYPVTRETYVTLNTLGDEDGSEMLPAEEEAELPKNLQHPNFREEE